MNKTVRLLFLLLGLSAKVGAVEKPAAQQLYPFVPNWGQWSGNHHFEAQFGGMKAFIGEQGLDLVLFKPDEVHEQLFHAQNGKLHLFALAVRFPGAKAVKPIGQEGGPVRQHYYLGDAKNWKTDVPAFSRLIQQELYPGIDLLWQQEEGNLKYDFVVKPGANPAQIRVDYRGIKEKQLKNGRLHLSTSLGELIEMAPVAWSETPWGREVVNCRYELVDGLLSFVFPDDYNPNYPLVIDPVLVFSTYSGSTANNFGFTASPDASGNFYTAGTVFDVGFPTTLGAFQETFVGNTVDPGEGLRIDVGILKFNFDGSQLLYASYLGGRRDEQPHSLNVNGYGELVVMGTTRSDNFPVATDAYDPSFNGNYDLFLTRISPDGSELRGSTYLGGPENDGINSFAPLRYQYADDYRGDVQITANNEIIVISLTNNTALVTSGSGQNSYGGGQSDGLIARFSENLTTLRWMSYMGGDGLDALYGGRVQGNKLIVVGGSTSGNLTTTAGAFQSSSLGGAEGIVQVVDIANGSLLHRSFLGSAGYDQLFFVDVDELGRIYVNGQTDSNIVTRGTNYNDPFSGQYIARFSPTLDSLHWLGRYGAKRKFPDLSPSAFLVDICGNIYISGWTGNIQANPNVPGPTNLTRTNNAIQNSSDGYDFYLAAFSRDMLTMSFGTYFGGATSADHVDGGTSRFDPRGVIYQAICAGCMADDLPTTPGSYSPTRGGIRCNNAALKIAFELETGIRANFGWVEPANWCDPVNLQIQDLSRIDGQTTYSWETSDGQTSSVAEPSFVFANPGTYSIKLTLNSTLACNRFDTLTRYIEVRDQPDVRLPNDTCVCADDGYVIQANVPGNTFSWTGPDGTGNQPDFAATSTGKYSLQLTDFYGCEATDSMEVVVSECFGKIPNVITPNGDGVNDVLQPLSQPQPDYEMLVFNRWGQLVFRSTNALVGWNGTNQQSGSLVEGGDYVVHLQANFCGTRLVEKKLQVHVAY